MTVWGTIGPRGAELCEDDYGNKWLWAFCHKDGCPNLVCRNLSDRWCYVHADGLPSLQEVVADAKVKEKA